MAIYHTMMNIKKLSEGGVFEKRTIFNSHTLISLTELSDLKFDARKAAYSVTLLYITFAFISSFTKICGGMI